MKENIVKITNIKSVTHDVKVFTFDKPKGYSFVPGQATKVSINTPELKKEKRPFSFTNLTSNSFLELTIKIYPSHNGITNELGKLKTGDELIIGDTWGAIQYKGEGVFIAGGAGVTPFIAILRDIQTKNKLSGNKLIFANKTKSDIILEKEFRQLLGNNFINILSDEKAEGYAHGMIDEDFLQKHISDFNTKFYVCGPPPMVDVVKKQLNSLGAEQNSIVMEV
ncbi:MAG: FAD-binding oxidoreductase [Bacteroidales bacterium]